MDLPKQQRFSLSIPGLPELQEMVHSFAEQTLQFAEFDEGEVAKLAAALGSAVRLVEAAVEQGGDVGLPVTIAATIDDVAVEFAVLEQGRPLGEGDENQDVGDIPQRIRPSRIFDRVWWVHRGPAGSELHLRKTRPHPEISVLTAAAVRYDAEASERVEQESEAEPSGESGEYRMRAFQEGDALEISRCIYEAYGYTYPNPDLFYPERIIALNRDGRLRSLVAESPGGDVVGHYALERPDLGPIAESGQAVVHHAHRGHGLMRLMRTAVEEDGRSLGLLGIWSQPTARHPFSQKMNLGFGSVPCGLSLGTTPASTVLRGDEDQHDDKPLRQSCFLYWHPLTPEEPLTASIPESFLPIVTELYEVRGREVKFETELRCAPPFADVAAAVHTVFDHVRNLGRIWVDRIGDSTADVIDEAVRVMQEAAGAESVFVDLPIDDPACAVTATELLSDGFLFSGIGPRFHARGDTAEDSLRLQKPLAAFDREGLVAEGELGQKLVDFILGA